MKINFNKNTDEIRRQLYTYEFSPYQLPEIYGRKVVNVEIMEERSKQRSSTILYESEKHFVLLAIDNGVMIF